MTMVRWYFAPPGATTIPGGTIWASSDWLDRHEKAETVVGEIPRYEKNRLEGQIPGIVAPRWSNGATPPGVSGLRPCGRPSDFLIAKYWSDSLPTLNRREDGIPLCCLAPAGGASLGLFTPRLPRHGIGLITTKIPAGAVGLVAAELPAGAVGLVAAELPAGAVGLVAAELPAGAVGLTFKRFLGGTTLVQGEARLILPPAQGTTLVQGPVVRSPVPAAQGTTLVQGPVVRSPVPAAQGTTLVQGPVVRSPVPAAQGTTLVQGPVVRSPVPAAQGTTLVQGEAIYSPPPPPFPVIWDDDFSATPSELMDVHLPLVGVGGYTPAPFYAGPNLGTVGAAGWYQNTATSSVGYNFSPSTFVRTGIVICTWQVFCTIINLQTNNGAWGFSLDATGVLVSGTTPISFAPVPGTVYTILFADDGTTVSVTVPGFGSTTGPSVGFLSPVCTTVMLCGIVDPTCVTNRITLRG